MEDFFNDTVAARLQYVTFPLELIGFTLALIEVRFPRAAAYLTRRIEQLAAPIDALRSGITDAGSVLERSLAVLLSRLLKAGFYLLTAVYGVQLVVGLASRGVDVDRLFGLLVGYVTVAIIMTVALVVLGVVVYFLVVGGSDFARRFVAGRAIGTLGLLIAGLGLIGELYQFLNQFVP